MVDRIGNFKKQEASASAANRYLALVKAILRRARDEWEWIDKIPRVKLFPEPKRRAASIKSKSLKNMVARSGIEPLTRGF